MQSMTGFGRGEASNETFSVNVELSSVNRKQAEITINLPRHLSELESDLRKLILQSVSRGRVMAQISIQHNNLTSQNLSLDRQKVRSLEDEFEKLGKELGREMQLTPSEILKIPNILIAKEILPSEVSELLTESTTLALKKLMEMRAREGADLLADCNTRLNKAEELLEHITKHAPLVLEHYRNNLLTKLADLGDSNWAEDERVIKEIALYGDRSDISEEITRFRSHLDRFREYLRSSEPVGRSLDFLCQELNRELNTIGSKANDAQLAQMVVEGKTEIEKIREQIQNVE